jgi:hypothetical protein
MKITVLMIALLMAPLAVGSNAHAGESAAGTSTSSTSSSKKKISRKEAMKLAIAYAQADKNHSYGGEESIKDSTTVLNTPNELELIQMLAVSMEKHGGLADQPILEKGIREAFNEDAYFVLIRYVDCDTFTNVLSVNQRTGKVEYLFKIYLD